MSHPKRPPQPVRAGQSAEATPVATASHADFAAPGGPAAETVPGEPPDTQDFLAAAEQASRRADWPEAERRWRQMRAALPGVWYCYTGHATALSGLGRLDEARRLLTEAAARFPQEPAVRHELARLAARLGNWPAAEAHWRAALRFENRPWPVYTELAGVLRQQGRLAEAEAVLRQGQAENPQEIALFTYYARLAWEREDWAAAVARWVEARNRFPITEEISSGLYQALLRLAEHDPPAADAAQRRFGLAAADAQDTRGEMRALLLRFESLGGSGPDGGCEFGGVQRERGAEPLGLFRWAGVTPASLIACLEGRFEGIGDAASTTVYLHDDDPDRLWQIGDTIYGTVMHSFVASKDVGHDRMLALACKRMRYLKQKLMADLAAPTKVFVLKLADRQVTGAEVMALSRAIRLYGPGELLCVCPADAAHPEGSIEPAAPGVFVGHIDFSGARDVVQRHPVWEALCRRMLAMAATPADFADGSITSAGA